MFHATDVEPDKPVGHKNATQADEAAGPPAAGSAGYVVRLSSDMRTSVGLRFYMRT